MSSKITIIGAGSVGATIAYKLSYEDFASEIVMIDINKDKVEGEVWISSREPASEARSPSWQEIMRMPRVPISLSSHPVSPRKPGQTRIELAQTNVKHHQIHHRRRS